MKKSHIFLGLLLVATIGVSAQNTIDKQGRKQGHWLKTDKNGAKIFEGNFKDGMETGTFEYFYPNGAIRMRNVFIEDGKLCYHEAYDESGHRLATGYYNQHNRDSVWHFYNEDGKLIKRAAYNMGIKEGTHIVFTSTGDTAEVVNWKDNRRDGRWWKRIGTKSYITATYKKGNIEGRLCEYDENGHLAREGYYKGGNRDGSYKYYENQELVVDEMWQDGRLADRKILIKTPNDEFISVFTIAYMMPKGLNQVIIYLNNGEKLITNQNADDLYRRLGNDILTLANKKSRIMVASHCIKGVTNDSEGREILDLDPRPDFDIFPDEDCMKMLHSRDMEQKEPTEIFGY